MVTIGVVCEGSHDYCFLVEIVDEFLVARGYGNNIFHPLQPKIDATSRQLDGGGYEAVRQWILSNNRLGMRKFFTPALFASSVVYDAIIVQIDGDVADLSADFQSSPFSSNVSSVSDRVAGIRSWLFSLAQIEPCYAKNLIAAVPTLQMEAWVLAGLFPAAQFIEARNRKRATKRLLKRQFAGSSIQQLKSAANQARSAINQMRLRAISFDILCRDMENRFI